MLSSSSTVDSTTTNLNTINVQHGLYDGIIDHSNNGIERERERQRRYKIEDNRWSINIVKSEMYKWRSIGFVDQYETKNNAAARKIGTTAKMVAFWMNKKKSRLNTEYLRYFLFCILNCFVLCLFQLYSYASMCIDFSFNFAQFCMPGVSLAYSTFVFGDAFYPIHSRSRSLSFISIFSFMYVCDEKKSKVK